MSTDLILQTDSTSSDATLRLAEKLGKRLRGGEVIELISDLGGGKTTFVQGLAHGLGSSDRVASPSFTVSKVYQAGDKELHHFDFYRLQKPGLLTHELNELLGDPHIVVAVEWADIVQNVLPARRLTVHFTNTGEDSRQLTFQYPKDLEYLVADLW